MKGDKACQAEKGQLFPILLEARRTSDKALIAVTQEAYVHAVSNALRRRTGQGHGAAQAIEDDPGGAEPVSRKGTRIGHEPVQNTAVGNGLSPSCKAIHKALPCRSYCGTQRRRREARPGERRQSRGRRSPVIV